MGRVSDMAMDQQQEGVDELLCEIDHWKDRAEEAERLLEEAKTVCVYKDNRLLHADILLRRAVDEWECEFSVGNPTVMAIKTFLEAKS